MTPFEEFCNKHGLNGTEEMLLTEYNEKYVVRMHEDDNTDNIQFQVVECLQKISDKSVGEKFWSDLENLEPLYVELEGVRVASWDFAVAARLKKQADVAVKAYNDYIEKCPQIDFVKY